MRDRLKHLTKGVAIYGAGDAAISVVNFLLLAVYVKRGFLTAVDYGALATLGSLEAFIKVVNRWGLDGAFMRFYHEREDGAPRQRSGQHDPLVSAARPTACYSSFALGISSRLAAWLVLDDTYLVALRLMLVNMFLVTFTFFPFHAMRLRDAAVTYSALTFTRSAGTLVLRIVLVIGYGLGITGVYLADLALTLILWPLLWRWIRPLVAAMFSMDELRQVLRFGLPRLPHGLAQQSLESTPKLLLGHNVSAGRARRLPERLDPRHRSAVLHLGV